MNIQKLRDMNLHTVADELERLREFKEKVESQEPVIRISGGRVVDFNPNYGGSVSEGAFYAKPVPADKPVTRQDVIDVLLSTRGQPEGVTADAILGLLPDKGTVAVSASTTDKPADDNGTGNVLWSDSHSEDEILEEHSGNVLFDVVANLWEDIRCLKEDKPAVAVPDGFGLIPMRNGKPDITDRMKVDCIGEFSWQEDAPYYDEDGELHDYVATHVVPWDLCKAIYKRMASVAMLEAAPSHSQQSAHTDPDVWHRLKTDPDVFDDVAAGRKTHEIRFNDRGFEAGHGLHLLKTVHTGDEMRAGAPLQYTGDEFNCVVTHVLSGYGLKDGWVILSIAPLSDRCPAHDSEQGGEK